MQTDAFPYPEPGILLAAVLGVTLLALAGLILFLGRKHVRWSTQHRPEDVTEDRPAIGPGVRPGSAPRQGQVVEQAPGERR